MPTKADHARLGAWVVLLEPDLGIDRHGAKRVVPMQVLCLGLPRTGTLSMAEALSTLGYQSPYHYSKTFQNNPDADMWLEAFDAQNKGDPNFDWRGHFDQLLGHCGAITDAPAVCLWRELIQAYPDAKVVLVERDVESWFKSLQLLLDGLMNPFQRYVLRYTDPSFFGRIFNTNAALTRSLFGTDNVPQIKAYAKDIYLLHYADIRAKVPKERLLNYRLGSGWEPLCDFLQVKAPDEPFPHRNEAKTVEQAISAAVLRSLKNSFFNLAPIMGVIAVVGAVVWQVIRT